MYDCGNTSQDAGSLGDVCKRPKWKVTDQEEHDHCDGLDKGGWLQGIVDAGAAAKGE